MSIKLDLPFPNWDLAPNSRIDRRKLTGIRKALKTDCAWIAKVEAGVNAAYFAHRYGREKNIPIALLFYPPNNNRRDRDNCLSAMKYGLDGVAEVFQIDDSRFGPVLVDIMEADPKRPRCELYIDNIDMVLNMILKGQNHVEKKKR